MKIHYLRHSAFEIETEGKKILIDPFLACVNNYKPENIYLRWEEYFRDYELFYRETCKILR